LVLLQPELKHTHQQEEEEEEALSKTASHLKRATCNYKAAGSSSSTQVPSAGRRI
jgi:hypothetical protein